MNPNAVVTSGQNPGGLPQAVLPTLEFLLDASDKSLQDLELSALNRASNLGKGIKEEMFAWAEQYAAAMLARWMLENREGILAAARREVSLPPIDSAKLFDSLTGR